MHVQVPHRLHIKTGAPIMLLRNLDPVRSHCNGTRYIVRHITRQSLRRRSPVVNMLETCCSFHASRWHQQISTIYTAQKTISSAASLCGVHQQVTRANSRQSRDTAGRTSVHTVSVAVIHIMYVTASWRRQRQQVRFCVNSCRNTANVVYSEIFT